ncbi:30S ribosomal protein S3 [Pseudoxanthomonas suwonensis]|uniref:30S ribosomal protein S3 n=1 Tax=Pseudoxanthomonas suwonensis TaxID=314722 RepID=A0A0E3UPY8_9GAMM|nr:30S ribosomal protein S3 [Pseudoxanthomonas suwonensis]
MDYLIVAAVTVPALALHVVLYLLVRRWMDRDLALSLAGEDSGKRAWMLERLAQSRRERVRRRDLPAWLEREAAGYRADAETAGRTASLSPS